MSGGGEAVPGDGSVDAGVLIEDLLLPSAASLAHHFHAPPLNSSTFLPTHPFTPSPTHLPTRPPAPTLPTHRYVYGEDAEPFVFSFFADVSQSPSVIRAMLMAQHEVRMRLGWGEARVAARRSSPDLLLCAGSKRPSGPKLAGCAHLNPLLRPAGAARLHGGGQGGGALARVWRAVEGRPRRRAGQVQVRWEGCFCCRCVLAELCPPLSSAEPAYPFIPCVSPSLIGPASLAWRLWRSAWRSTTLWGRTPGRQALIATCTSSECGKRGAAGRQGWCAWLACLPVS